MLSQNQVHRDGNKTLNNHDRNRQAYTLPEMDQRENEYKIEEGRKHQDTAKDVLHPKRHHRLNAKDITERHDKWEETQNAQDQDRLFIRIAHDDVHDGLRQDKGSQRSEETQSTDITNRLMQKAIAFSRDSLYKAAICGKMALDIGPIRPLTAIISLFAAE